MNCRDSLPQLQERVGHRGVRPIESALPLGKQHVVNVFGPRSIKKPHKQDSQNLLREVSEVPPSCLSRRWLETPNPNKQENPQHVSRIRPCREKSERGRHYAELIAEFLGT